MSDLNKNKVIFKSEQEIRDYVTNMVEDSLLPCDIEEHQHEEHQHEEHQHENGKGHGCCGDTFSKSIQLAIEASSKETVIENEVQTLLAQQALDSNTSIHKSESKDIYREFSQVELDAGQCYQIKVNIIINGTAPTGPVSEGSKKTADRAGYIDIGGSTGIIATLNEAYSDNSNGPGTYGSRKQKDNKIRWVLESTTVLDASECIAWSSQTQMEANINGDPIRFGFKEGCFNIYFADLTPTAAATMAMGAYMYYPVAPFPYKGQMMFRADQIDGGTDRDLAYFKETLVHEMGHGLNLYHTFGNCGAGSLATCDCGDDGVSDTPLQKPTDPAVPGISSQLGPPWQTTALCGDQDNDGTADVSMPENWMDYSLMNASTAFPSSKFFTQGQNARMLATFAPGGPLADIVEIVNCDDGDPNPGGVVGPVDGGGGNFYNHLMLSGKSLATQIENKFFGENFGNYLQVHRHTFKGRCDSRASNTDFKGVRESLSTMEDILFSAHNQTTVGFKLLNEDFCGHSYADMGKGKVISVDFSENTNPVRLHDFTVVFECYHQGSISSEMDETVFGASVASSLINKQMEYLESFSENFSFDSNEDHGYEYSHSLNFKYYSGDSSQNYISLSKNLANDILVNFEPDIPFVGENARLYNDANIQAHEHRYDETYDLYNLEFSFTKKFSQLSESTVTNSFKHSRNITLDEEGFLTATENGTVDARYVRNKADLEDAFLSTVGASYGDSWARCHSDFDRLLEAGWFEADNLDITRHLHTEPISVSKGYDPVNAKHDYSLTFSSNPKYFTDTTVYANDFVGENQGAPPVSREFTLSVAEDFEAKSLTVTENGTIKAKGVRSLTYDGWAHLLQMSTNTSPTRILDFVNEYTSKNSIEQNPNRGIFASNIFQEENRYLRDWPAGKPQWDTMSIDYPKYGGAMNYTLTYVFDGKKLGFGPGGVANVTTIEITTSNNEATHHHNNFIIPNLGELTQTAYQSTIGTKDITVTAQFSNYLHRRKNTTVEPPNLTNEITYLKSEALKEMRRVAREREEEVIRDIWISSSSHSFDNTSRILTLNLQVSWVAVNKLTQPHLKRYVDGGAI